MKKIVKIFLRAISLIILILVIAIVGFIVYLETSIDSVISKERQVKVWAVFYESEALPEIFYTTIEKYYPRYFELGVWESELRLNLGLKQPKSAYNQLYIEPSFWDTLISFNQIIILLEIEEQCSQRKCYDYLMNTSYFGFELRNVKDAAQFYYKKDLHELTEREIIELHLIKEAPTLYNPIRNKAILDKKVYEVMNKI